MRLICLLQRFSIISLAALRVVLDGPVITRVATEAAAAIVPQLYYIAMSRSRLSSLASQARAELGPKAWSPPESMAIDDAQITTAVDITDYWDIKLAALGAHASQSDAAALLTLFTAAGRHDDARWFEEYVRAEPTPIHPTPVKPTLVDLVVSTL